MNWEKPKLYDLTNERDPLYAQGQAGCVSGSAATQSCSTGPGADTSCDVGGAATLFCDAGGSDS